jgi:hypothetical protein
MTDDTFDYRKRPGIIWVQVPDDTTDEEYSEIKESAKDALSEYQVVVSPESIEPIPANRMGEILGKLFYACGIDPKQPLEVAVPGIFEDDDD